jgi:hypothetical protein
MATYPQGLARTLGDEYYSDVIDELKRSLQQGAFRAGELLTQIAEEKLYGHWKTFEDFVAGEIRITKAQAYRLMFAYRMRELLKENNLPLPINERQVRPLRPLRTADKLLAWSLACKKKQFGQPTHLDVAREVNLLLEQPDAENDEAYRSYRNHLERTLSDLRRASDVLASGELDFLLTRADKKARERQKRLLWSLNKLVAECERHIAKVELRPSAMAIEGRD